MLRLQDQQGQWQSPNPLRRLKTPSTSKAVQSAPIGAPMPPSKAVPEMKGSAARSSSAEQRKAAPAKPTALGAIPTPPPAKARSVKEELKNVTDKSQVQENWDDNECTLNDDNITQLEEVTADVMEGSKRYSRFTWQICHFASEFNMSTDRARDLMIDVEEGSGHSCLAFKVPPANGKSYGEATYTELC